MAQHSLLGASGAARWLACPGSFWLSRSAKPSAPSIYAATGTVAHELIEEASVAGRGFTLPPVLGETREVDGVQVIVDEDMVESVNVMLDYARKRAHNRLYKSELRVSPRLPIKPPVEVFGSLDLIIADPREGWFEIIDYKHGAGVPVKAERNAQLLYYAAGALAMLEDSAPKAKFHEAILTVVQPRVPGENPIKQWSLGVLDLELWVADVLVPGIEAALMRDAPFHPGEHCRFCPGLAVCPALLWKAQDAAKGEFDYYTGQDPTPMTVSDQLHLADQLDVWAQGLRDKAKQKLETGGRIEGWRLVPTRSTRRWVDEGLAEGVLTNLGIPEDELHEYGMRSPAQIEKIVVKAKGQRSWDAVRDQLIDVSSSGTKLAPTEQDVFDLLEALP